MVIRMRERNRGKKEEKEVGKWRKNKRKENVDTPL